MRKFLKQLHKWLSIPVGILIVIICLTGAILVFQDEILEASHPERYFVEEIKEGPIPLEDLIPLVNNQLDSNEVARVQIFDNPERTYRMSLKEGFRITAFVDQYTGKVTGIYEFRESTFYTMMALHRWLLDGSRTWGKYTVGISTLLFVFILVSGFIVWMPRRLKKSRFKIQYRKGIKRLFYDLHNVLGAYACLVLLICALTGMMWSFEWYRNTVFKIFGAEVKQEQGHGGRGQNRGGDKEEKPQLNIGAWGRVVNTLKDKNPDYEYISVQDGSASVHLKSALLSRDSDQYKFDKSTGEIIKVSLFKDQEGTSKIWAWAYSLHVGNYWGIWSKIFTCFFALVGASLPLTGYYIYFTKRSGKAKRRIREKTEKVN